MIGVVFLSMGCLNPIKPGIREDATQILIPEDIIRSDMVRYYTYNETKIMILRSGEGIVNIRYAASACGSQEFHVENNQLICDGCGTKWSLKDLSGISGKARDHPPAYIPYQKSNGYIVIDKKDIHS